MKLSGMAFATLCVCITVANAETPEKWSMTDRHFDGTWVVEPTATTFDLRTPILSLDRGVFRRTDCRNGPVEVPADGADHEVKRQLFFDSMAVRVRGPREVELTDRLSGKQVWQGTYMVSKDNRTLTLKYVDDRAAKSVAGTLVYDRDGDAPNADHPISGTWRPEKLASLSPGIKITIRTEFNPDDPEPPAGSEREANFQLAISDGRSASGKADAHDYALYGYLPNAGIAVSRLMPNMLQINQSQGHELVQISRASVSDDGETMTLSQIDWLCIEKTNLVLKKTQL